MDNSLPIGPRQEYGVTVELPLDAKKGQIYGHLGYGPPERGEEVDNDHSRVLIFNPSTKDSLSMLDGLQAVRTGAIACQTKQCFLQILEKYHIDVAVIVLNSKAWWKDELRLFCNSIRYLQKNPEPEILCVLNWPPKNAEEAAIDRLSGDALRADVRHEW